MRRPTILLTVLLLAPGAALAQATPDDARVLQQNQRVVMTRPVAPPPAIARVTPPPAASAAPATPRLRVADRTAPAPRR